MDWLTNLFTNTDSIAHIVLLYAAVIAIGHDFGKLKFCGVSLGVTFVLFIGILAGHFGFTAPLSTLNFMQDFGLILFVYMIGLQVGPSFFSTFKKGGIELNMLACAGIALNIGVMFACYFLFFDTTDRFNLPMLVGTLSGAVTNTPSLGAATEALREVFAEGEEPLIASGYACAYPMGVIGIILSMIIVRKITKTNLEEEDRKLDEEAEANAEGKPHFLSVMVDNKHLSGKTIQQVREFLNREFVCSRILHNGHVVIPMGTTEIHFGDMLFIVCTENDAEPIVAFLGHEEKVAWAKQDVAPVSRRIVVTNEKVNGKKLGSMHFSRLYGVNVTRITRQGMDIFASPSLELQVGDRVMIVGPEDCVNRVAEKLGNSVKRLDNPNIAMIFVGIILGIIFGSIPIALPGLPVPVKLGIAGGPLIIAILIGRFGYKMKLITYTTTSANLMLREIGLLLFLASVGIKAGAVFVDTILSGDGLKYFGCGILITMIPAIVVGLIARLKFKFNYFTVVGLITGMGTAAPALAYVNTICSKDAPAVGYSTVYPLTMFLRIFTAQLIILFCCA